MPSVSPERQPQLQEQDSNRDVPCIATIASVLDEVIDIARQRLPKPISVEIETWQDGQYKIRVDHSEPTADRFYRQWVVQYHSQREDVEALSARIDREGTDGYLVDGEIIDHIPDPLKKSR